MPNKPFTDTPIALEADPVTQAQIDRFARATGSEYFSDWPLSFPTVFRTVEFQWVDRLNIDMHGLLHTDQEYEFLSPLREGDVPTVVCRPLELRRRGGTLFLTLESEIRCGDRVAVIARSSFLVRNHDAGDPA